MTPDLQNALTIFVNQLTTVVQSGAAQLPAVLNDIVAYQLFDAWFSIGLGVLLLILTLGLGWLSLLLDDSFSDTPIYTGIGALFTGIGAAIFLVGGAWQVYYVTHFPRLVVLDYLKHLV